MKSPSPRLEIKAATRLIEHGKTHTSVTILCTPLEHKNGYVFLLAESEQRSRPQSALHVLFQETVDRLVRRLQEQSHLQHRFEQALQALNGDLANLFASDRTLQDLSAIIGVVQHETFIVSGAGTLTALFLRKNAKQHVRFFDLMHNLTSESGPPTSDKFFSTVLDGSLANDDVMLFATGPFQKYVSLEESHPLFTTLPPTSILESIDANFPVRAQSGIILFQMKPEKNVLTGYSGFLGARESMQGLTEVETEAAEQLGLQAPHVREAFSRLVSLVRTGTTHERVAFAQNLLQRVWKGTRLVATYVFRLASNAASTLISFIGALFQNSRNRKRGFSQAMSAWSRTWKTGRYQFFKLSKSHRLILVGCLLLFALLVGSVYAVRTRQHSAENKRELVQSMERVDELLAAAQAGLIYNDRVSASDKLREAETLLNGLISEKNDVQVALDAQRTELEAAWASVRRVLKPQLTRLIVPSQNAIATNGSLVFTSDGGAWRIDGGTLVASNIANVSNVQPRRATTYKADTVFLAADDRLGRYRGLEGSLQLVRVNAAESELRLASALEHYGERLYVLVPEHNQIYRHQLVDDQDYANATPWLTDTVTFESANDIAIDGTVWVADGARVRHFDRGVEGGFPLTAIDPPLNRANAVWTQADIPELFVLDSAAQRLLVLHKESGELLGQYVDPSFEPATDIHINYTDRNAYIVTPNQVLLFPLTSVVQ